MAGAGCRALAALLLLLSTFLVGGAVLQSDHLVVLSHGIMGNRNDLLYLSQKLEEKGCVVLRSIANEVLQSLNGIQTGGRNLAKEIEALQALQPNLKRISFVGNSMGGLYARYAIKELFESGSRRIATLEPYFFMTIATPHLGVRDYTFLDEYGVTAPSFLKNLVARTLKQTGRELFSIDASRSQRLHLLFRMATEAQFLLPLKAFATRRLYANLNLDLVVPLGTAAFLPRSEVDLYRAQFSSQSGVVKVITTTTDGDNEWAGTQEVCSSPDEEALQLMRVGLNSCGWEKFIVHFRGFIPLAHNKIAALTKYTDTLDALLGFTEGRFVMDAAAKWLTS
ncbi:putative serine esterase-domain-containing protein [Ochromonadaceae sp. CCMP2298]|nr:putative serine esterase-domain-containing protein [Ochromonadaceae sp. CCMP2298]